MGERITIEDAKRNIEKAFDGWLNAIDDEETDDPENPGEEAQDLNASHARFMAFLAQVEADQKQLATYKAATVLLPVLRKLCDWDDGCLYVNGTACPELAEPMRLLEAALAKTTD